MNGKSHNQCPVKDFTGFKLLCERVARSEPHRLASDRPIWIFGSGQFGMSLCRTLIQEGFHVEGFIDSNPRSGKMVDLPVLTWQELKPAQLEAQLAVGIFNREMPLDELELIARSTGFNDVFMPWDLYAQFSRQLGWRFWLSEASVILDNLSAIEHTYRNLADETSRQCLLDICVFRLGRHNAYAGFRHSDAQYFNDLTLTPFKGRKVNYVDGGAYQGDTLLELAAQADVGSAFLFEPDPDNLKALVNTVHSMELPAVCMPLAVSDSYSILSFNAGNGEGCAITKDGSQHIAAVALDEVLHGYPVNFIKLDVEGAEIPALRGAEGIIKRDRPVLAISLYHRPKDIWEIPELLSAVYSEYQFYIRQHYYNSFDSVLYAIPK
ncbi:MAG: FkbM family methyltransferase [Methylomicrobium sp.]